MHHAALNDKDIHTAVQVKVPVLGNGSGLGAEPGKEQKERTGSRGNIQLVLGGGGCVDVQRSEGRTGRGGGGGAPEEGIGRTRRVSRGRSVKVRYATADSAGQEVPFRNGFRHSCCPEDTGTQEEPQSSIKPVGPLITHYYR